ncbi:hypothetical protein Taro_053883 [Colocasia esculenta]|uniref:Uncharacterized protein n=1 Tax=Colocasia esculenta TaxID=4460 RepID=A0A843XMA8_COLES|nr:hypothetical protein [Colocasia esculenta]
MKEGGGEGYKRECEVVGGISEGPEDGRPEIEEDPVDDDTGGTSKIGGGGEMGVEDAGDEVELWMMKVQGSEWRKELGAQELQLLLLQLCAAHTLTPKALMALTPSQLALKLLLALMALPLAHLALVALEHLLHFFDQQEVEEEELGHQRPSKSLKALSSCFLTPY